MGSATPKAAATPAPQGNVVYQFDCGGGRGLAFTLDLAGLVNGQINDVLDGVRLIGDRQRAFFEIEGLEKSIAEHKKTKQALIEDMERLDKQHDEDMASIAAKVDTLRGEQDKIAGEARAAWGASERRGDFKLTGRFQASYNAQQLEIVHLGEDVTKKKAEREKAHANSGVSQGRLQEEIDRLQGEIDKRKKMTEHR